MSDTSRTLTAKFDGDTKGLKRATAEGEREVDRFNKSVDKKFRKSGDDSGKGFVAGLKKWISPSSLGEVGKSGGTVFGSGLLGALKTPVLGPAILAVLAGAVAVAAPAAGAIAGTALVAGFGAGLVGLGIVFAAKSKNVQDVWSKTLASMGADMQLLSKPFESTLIAMASIAQRTFGKFKPSLEAVFKEMAPVVTKFVDQVAKGMEQLQPAIRPAAEAFNAVLGSLGPAIQSALGNVSSGFTRLAESVKQNPDALADTVEGLGQATEKVLNLITALNNLNGKFSDVTGGTSAVDLVMGKANGTLGKFVSFIKGAADPLSGVKNGFMALAGSADEATGSVGLTGDATKLFTQGLNANQVAAELASKGQTGLGATADALAVKFNNQLAATRAANAEMLKTQNLALGAAGAEINYQAAIDSASASIKENGRQHGISTEKGRANKTALLGVASAANAQTTAMLESNRGTAAASKSATTAQSNFSTLAQKMGYSKKEADRLASSLIAIPPKKTSTVAVNGAGAAKGSVDALGRSIDGLHNKVVTITYRQNGIVRTQQSNTIASAGRASGGLTQPKRRYLLGERGAEIAEFNSTGTGGPKILSAEQTRRELTQSSQPIVVENHIEIGGEVVRVVRTEIKANDRDTKRRVMAGVRS